jgi:hypothetical protein
MIIKIGKNKFINLDNIESFSIVKKKFPNQAAKYDEKTNTIIVEEGFTMEFVGTSGERYAGYVYKSASAVMGWWMDASAPRVIAKEIANDRN